MRKICAIGVLLVTAACGDWTRVPPPPIPLTAIAVAPAGSPGDLVLGSVPSGVPLMRAAPAQALLTLHVPDIAGSVARFDRTSVAKLLKSPELERAMAPFRATFGMLQGAGGASMGASGVDTGKLLGALKGEFLFCLEQLKMPVGEAPPTIRLICGWSVRGAEEQAEGLLKMLAGMAATNRSLTIEHGVSGGTEFVRIVGKTPFEYVVEGAVHGDAMLLGLGRETVTDAIGRIEDSDLPALTESPSYRRAMGRCAHPEDTMRIHVNVAAILQALGEHLPPDALQLVDALGLDRVRSLTTTLRFEGPDIVTATLLDSPGGEDLLTRTLRDQKAEPAMISLIPADATSFTLASIDGNRILATLRKILPAEGGRQIETVLSSLRRSGVDLEGEVFSAFGPELALVNLPHGSGDEQGMDAIWSHFMGTAVVLRIRDRARAAKVLSRMPAGEPGLTRVDGTLAGSEFVTYRFDAGQLPPELSLCYAQKDDYLLIALSEAALRQLLEYSSPVAPQRFRDLVKDIPEEAALITYDDVKHGIKLSVDAALSGISSQMGAAGAMPDFDISDIEHLIDRLKPSSSFTVADDRGVFVRTRSATGGFGSIGGVSGLATLCAVAIPNLASARIHSNEKTAQLTLRAVRSAQKTFRNNVMRDEDGDREGEYGMLMELLGQPRPGEHTRRATSPLLGGLTRRSDGEYQGSGYLFRTYLPAEDGSPIGSHESAERIAKVDGDLAEYVMVTVAWPVARGSSGERAFILNSDGALYACEDGSYSGDRSPPPDLLLSQPGNLASAPLSDVGLPRDGFRWVRLR